MLVMVTIMTTISLNPSLIMDLSRGPRGLDDPSKPLTFGATTVDHQRCMREIGRN